MAHSVTGAAVDMPPDLPAGALTSVDVYISSQCNRRCSYCFLPTDFFTSGKRMSVESFFDIVQWSKRQGVKEVTLLGGEPSLHPSFATMVRMASSQDMDVRVVTNGARSFRRQLADGTVTAADLARVAVSLDTLDPAVQDEFRGPGAWRDAMETIDLLTQHSVVFDINVTAVRPVLSGLDKLIEFADDKGCRRVNIHWPSTIGIGTTLDPGAVPKRDEWQELTRRVARRTERRPDFYVEIERGYLADDEQLAGCALADFSNLQILPDGRAYRCGLLVDQEEMASLAMTGGQLRLTSAAQGEERLRTDWLSSCDSCPVMHAEGRRACIYDKVSSLRPR
jgi:MoaA/NifB/PqqE/SkfB family radical SAM enzyme